MSKSRAYKWIIHTHLVRVRECLGKHDFAGPDEHFGLQKSVERFLKTSQSQERQDHQELRTESNNKLLNTFLNVLFCKTMNVVSEVSQ